MRRIAATILGAVLALTLSVGRVNAAEGVITLNLKDARLSQVLDLIKQQVAFEYVLTPGVNGEAPVTIAINNKPFDEALKLVLSTAKASFDVVQDVYIIKPGDAPGAGAAPVGPTAPITNGIGVPAAGGFTGGRPTVPPRPATTRPTTTVPAAAPGAPMAMPGMPGAGTGVDTPNATASAKGMPVVIPLRYADAPALAMLFSNQTTGIQGMPLRYQMLMMMSGGGAYGGNNGYGNNNGGYGNNNGGGWGNNNNGGGWGNNNGNRNNNRNNNNNNNRNNNNRNNRNW